MRNLTKRIFTNFQKWLLKLKPKHFWFIVLLTLSLIYITACLFPLKVLNPSITNNEVTLNDLLTRSFQLIAAIATFISAFVALFRDELRKIFLEIHKLRIDFDENKKLSEETISDPATDNVKRATNYQTTLEFFNEGNIYLKGCELYIENIKSIGKINIVEKKLMKSSKQVSWNDKKENKILIPIKGRAYHTVMTINSPESRIISQESANSSSSLSSPSINISGQEISYIDISEHIITIDYLLCIENSSPRQFQIVIEWNGKWENRLSEMQNNCKIEIKGENE